MHISKRISSTSTVSPVREVGRRSGLFGRLVFMCILLGLSYAVVIYGPWSAPAGTDGPGKAEILKQGDDVLIKLPCMDNEFTIRGHNLAGANIQEEFAADKYGICNGTATGLDQGGLVLVCDGEKAWVFEL